MKIGIVTVYNSYNCGSYLQAYALKKTLEKMGHQVVFVKRDVYKTNKLPYRMMLSAKRMLRGNIKRAILILKEYFLFRKIQKTMQVIADIGELDLLVYGSDTIWNMEDGYFKENWKRYWGVGVEKKRITYAASVGSTAPEVFYENPVFKDSINKFSGVAVRDMHTYGIAKELLFDEEKLQLVIDPTMLLPVNEYDAVESVCKEKDFILMYYSGPMSEEMSNHIKAFAKAQGKKIIRFSQDIPFDPRRMIGYYKAADYVITNTFHGNVFSIVYNKRFISLGKEKKKVENVLKDFGLENRLIDMKDDPAKTLLEDIDYDKVNEILDKKRAESLAYLNKFVK